jgi:hypothetical protein
MAAPHYPPHHAVPPQQGNGLAVAGMVLGILGLALCWLGFIGMICALIGVILSGIGLAKSNKVGKGKGMAIAGLVCGVLGLIAGVVFILVVVRGFTQYIEKAKTSEAQIQLRAIETKVKSYYIMSRRFPPSAPMMPGPAGSGCNDPSGRIPAKSQSAWDAHEGWKEMGFHIDEDSRYSYEWKDNGTSAVALAVGDIDCDGTLETHELRLDVLEGNLMATYTDR